MSGIRETGYPMIALENGRLRVSVYLPDAIHGYYRGTRFDWSGIIRQVDCKDHRFYAPLHPRHDPQGHDCVSGPAEEFAMFNPMGFAEARAGQSFVKIGVGLLEKAEQSEYRFNGHYRLIRAGDWEVEHRPDRAAFLQEVTGERGWAYSYRKVIRLVPDQPGLVIEHRLENSGENIIDIDNYNHNFTLIDDVPYGPDYRVEFPFSTQEPVSINGLATFRGNAIEVDEPLGDNSLWLPVFEGDGRVDDNAAIVRNTRTGAAVAIKGDAPITRMVFWAVERAACPEPFIRLRIAPGQVTEWSSRYLYSVDDEPGQQAPAGGPS